MTRADGDAVLVGYLAHFLSWNLVGDERNYTGLFGRRSNKPDAWNSGERVGRIRQQRALMRRDIFHPDPIEIVHCCTKPDRRTKRRGAGFEALRRIGKRAVVERHPLNHVAAALP